MSILKFERASKEYTPDGEPVRALEDVSLEVQRGDFVALVGRSGCGKSTLLHLAGAMDFPTSGRVLIDGVVTSRLSDAQLTRLRRDKVGFIFQSFQLLPALSVIENVELPILLKGRLTGQNGARAIAQERLDWVEMESYASRMPHQLSGGQMQRVAIARALVNSPPILLADEPTGNLDSSTSDRIIDVLRRVASEKQTAVLMATHSVEAAAISDRIVKLHDGRVIGVIEPARRI